jgi:3-hydroxybenzoate/4-hydroxybenzoate---CoA ligase
MNAADFILTDGRDEAPALICDGETLSRGGLRAMSARFGNGLRATGVAPGDRVLFALDDRPVLYAAYLGCLRIGAVAVAINPRWKDTELEAVLADSEARLMLVEPDRVFDDARVLRATDDLFAEQPTTLENVEMAGDDPAFWIYTSGTTGTPKAAVHCHRAENVATAGIGGVSGLGPDDRVLITSKTFFAFALAHGLFGALSLGASVILHRPWPRPDDVLALAKQARPTAVYSVPTLYRAMLESVGDLGDAFAYTRRFVSAGEPLPPVLLERWREATGQPIAEGIGTSETVFLVIANPPDAVRPGSAGRPVPGLRVELRDENGRRIGDADRVGDLWVSADSVADGYWKRPELSAELFVDGWFRTGDRFRFDADGYWYHQGRRDDMLKIAGQWVSPAEIENCVTGAKLCGEAALVAAPDGDGLDRPILFVAAVGTEREADIADTVRETVARELSPNKCPAEVRLIGALPRTATGKVQRFRLREMAQASNRET